MGWWRTGGILALCQLIQRHQAEVVADLRSKFGVGLWDVALRELLPLVRMLHRDPSSWLFAAVNEWEFPASRELLALAELYDAYAQTHTRKGQKAKPYPRPFADVKKYGGRGKNKRRTPAELEAIFARRKEA